MSRKKSSLDSSEIKRYHITVPLVDKQVIEWVNAQDNISHSMRILIKAYVGKYGYVDPLCLPASELKNIFGPYSDMSEISEPALPETAKIQSVPNGTIGSDKGSNSLTEEAEDAANRSMSMLDSLMGI